VQVEVIERKTRGVKVVSEPVEVKSKDAEGRSKRQRRPAKEVSEIEEIKASEEPVRNSRNAKAAKEEKQNLKKEDKQKVTKCVHIYRSLLILSFSIKLLFEFLTS
jgi:hypothetical protein